MKYAGFFLENSIFAVIYTPFDPEPGLNTTHRPSGQGEPAGGESPSRGGTLQKMDFKGKLLLAPLAGVTDTIFRRLCRENGADIVVTEMVSAKGLLCNPFRSGRYLAYDEAERPVGAQLFGSDPEEIERAAVEVANRKFDFLDINMGCPARKVTSSGSGSAILSDPVLAGRIARAAIRGSGLPVTAKIRSGFCVGRENFLDVAAELFDAGVAAVTLHPRHRGQMFSGEANWEQIASLKKAFPGRVIIGNGDVRLPDDAARMIAKTNCDGVMVGRATMGNPWIFTALKAAMALRESARAEAETFLSSGDRRALILRHGKEMFLLYGNRGIIEMRKHLAWYSRGIPGAAAFRAHLSRIIDHDSFRETVERYF